MSPEKKMHIFQALAAGQDGQRLSILQEMGIPPEWVVAGDLPQEIWDHISDGATVIPLKHAGSKSTWLEENNHIFMLVVVDSRLQSGWSWGIVYEGDFAKTPAEILREAKTAQDSDEAKMKELVYIALTGHIFPG